MRKLPQLIIFVIALCTLLTACGCKHEYTSAVTKEATCAAEGEETFTCSLCGDSYTRKIDKTATHLYIPKVTKEPTVSATGIKTYTCLVCNDSYTEEIDKILPDWEIGYYVDSFGDHTSDAYVVGEFYGTFSNSATASSDLMVFVYLDKSAPNMVQIRLLEYEKYNATFTSSATITVKTKDANGKTKSYDAVSVEGDLVVFSKSFVEDIMNNSQLSINIVGNSKYQSIPDTYNFKINNIGLQELYEKI